MADATGVGRNDGICLCHVKSYSADEWRLPSGLYVVWLQKPASSAEAVKLWITSLPLCTNHLCHRRVI